MPNRPACLSVGLTPRFLTKRAAASYCGIQLCKFDKICDIVAVKFGNDQREHRYDIRQLDEWCDKQSGITRNQKDWLAGLDDDEKTEIHREN